MLSAQECLERARACRDAAAFLLGSAGQQRHVVAALLQSDAQRLERLAARRAKRVPPNSQRARFAA